MKKWILLLCSFSLCTQCFQSFTPIYANDEDIITEVENIPEEIDEIIETGEENEDNEIIEEEVVIEQEETILEDEEITETEQQDSSYFSAQDDTGNTANLVLFVSFSDTTHLHSNASYFDGCFIDNPKIAEYWTGDFGSNPWSMKAYLNSISYGQLNVAQIIPQYDSSTNAIQPLSLPHTTAYYLGNGGSYTNDGSLLEDAIQVLSSNNSLPSDINLDRNNDGVIDNITIVVPEEYSSNQSIDVTSHASYANVGSIHSKNTGSYTIISENHLYNSLTGSGLIIHEYLHTRGLKDLYSNTNGLPVYLWDIMASDSCYLQYPLAYFRNMLGWIDIDTITENQTVTLTSASKAGQTDSQAVILKTPYSDDEFFVIEYRQKGSASYSISNQGTNSYDTKIPGSGIVVYRINTSLGYYDCKGGAPWSTYIFRENDTYTNGGESASGDIYAASYLSLESGRTSYGSANSSDGVQDGAITYSDNVNSGIIIKNVGSAKEDTITFEVEFTNFEERQIWEKEIEDTTSSYLATSCTDSNGTQYILKQTDYYSSSILYKVNNGSLETIANGPSGDCLSLHMYNNEIYVVYLSTSGNACIDQLINNTFTNVYTSADYPNLLSAKVTALGIVIGCTTYDYSSWTIKTQTEMYCFNNGSISKLGNDSIGEGNGAYQISIAEYDSKTFILYRGFGTNELGLKSYDSTTNSWNSYSLGLTGSGEIYGLNNNLYMIYVCDTGKYIYEFKTNCFQKIVNDPFTTDSSETPYSLAVNGNNIYVTYHIQDGDTLCKTIDNEQWKQIGNPISSNYLDKIESEYKNGKLYILFTENAKLYLKTLKIEQEKTYSITYNTNGGSGEIIDSNSYTSGSEATILSNSCSKEGYHFVEWNTKKDGSGISYHPQDFVTINDNICLYAIWQEDVFANLLGYSMTLSNKIEVNFFMEISESITQDKNAKMILTSPSEKEVNIFINSLTPEEINGKSVYRFTCPVSAKEMTSEVQAKLVYLDSQDNYTFSVQDYVEYINENESDENTLKLANAMMNYGYHTQKYFNYKTDQLPENVEVPQSHSYSSFEKIVTEADSTHFIGARFILGSSLSLKLYFITGVDLLVDDVLTYTISKEDSYTVITFNDIKLNDVFTLETEDGFNLTYHTLSYAFEASKSNNQDLINLCNALYSYMENLNK